MNITVQVKSETEYQTTWSLSCRYGGYIYAAEYISKKYRADYLASTISLMIKAIATHQDTGNTAGLDDCNVIAISEVGEELTYRNIMRDDNESNRMDTD